MVTDPNETPAEAGQSMRHPSRLSQQFIKQTCYLLLLMLVEASRVLTEGMSRDPAAWTLGRSWPSASWRPAAASCAGMDTFGLRAALEKLSHYESLGPRFQPTEQMRTLAALANCPMSRRGAGPRSLPSNRGQYLAVAAAGNCSSPEGRC